MRLIHRRFASALCVLACALSLTAAARADPSWRLLGPYGGNILSLAVDPANPRVVYAGSPAGGVFKSADAGAKWVWSGAGLETDNFFRGITALAVDPRNPARIFAGVQGYGVYRSIDAGRTWHSAFTRPAGETWRLVIDPNPGGAVYAGSSSGIFRSLDGGTSWQARGPSVPVIALAFDPAFRILYAGLALGGVLRSANGGATWTAGRGLPEGQAFSLVVDPRQAGVVVAGFDRSMARSTDFGRTWTRVKKTQSPVVALASQRSKRLLYAAVAAARIFRSADSGATWQAAPGQPSDRDFNALAAGPGFVYTATKSSEHLGGIFRSSDAASTWTLSVKGFSTLTTTLAVDPSEP
jgi:photosystem II stability/assembly factor-like uncharacterized protein